MAYRLCVYRLADRGFSSRAPDVGAPEFEVRERRCDELCVFDAPLGSGGVVYSYWSRPAADLGLPLLARMYAEGLEVSGPELTTAREEVDRLSSHWLDTIESDEMTTYSFARPPPYRGTTRDEHDVLLEQRGAQRVELVVVEPRHEVETAALRTAALRERTDVYRTTPMAGVAAPSTTMLAPAM